MRKIRSTALLTVALLLGLAALRASAASSDKPEPPLKVIAYYFHITQRCETCLAIESQAKEAIGSGFPNELKEGTIEWRLVNVDPTQNRHFIRDFQLHTSSLVLVKMRNGKRRDWRNLDKVWTLVKRKSDFAKYVQENVRKYLEN